MSAAVPWVKPSHMECEACGQQFTEPKLLFCGHLLCRHCLVSRLQAKPEAHCPRCYCAIVDPKERKSGQSPEDIADGFPTELALAALIEADRLLSKPHECCGCFTEPAVSMCFNCGDMLCQSCTAVHGRLSVSRRHKVGDLASLTAQTLAANRPATCDEHEGEISKAYCPSHGASICMLCALTEHQQCPDVTKLETKAEEAQELLKEVKATLSAREKKLKQAIRQLDQQLKEIEKHEQEIETTCARLESAFEAFSCRMKKVKTSYSNDTLILFSRKYDLLQRKEKLTSHKHVIDRVQGIPTHSSFGHMSTVMNTRVRDLDRSAAVLLTDVNVVSTETLTFDLQAVSRIEKELSQLGQVKVASYQNAFDKPASLRFHDNHGVNIKLSNDQQTAERTSTYGACGIVMSCDPMVTDMLYEVRIEKTSKTKFTDTLLGVVTNSPSSFSTLPKHFCAPYPDVLCIVYDGSYVFGDQKTDKWRVLNNLKVGSLVGLALDSGRSLHLYVGGKDQGVVAPDIPDPCYFMFDMWQYCQQVTALSVKPPYCSLELLNSTE